MEKSISCILYPHLVQQTHTYLHKPTNTYIHTLAHGTHAPLSNGEGQVEVPPIDRSSLAPPGVHSDNALCNIPLFFFHTCLQLRLIKRGPQTQPTYVHTFPALHRSQQHWHSTKVRPKPEGLSTPPSSPPHHPPSPPPPLHHITLPPLSLTTTSPSHPSPSPLHHPPASHPTSPASTPPPGKQWQLSLPLSASAAADTPL